MINKINSIIEILSFLLFIMIVILSLLVINIYEKYITKQQKSNESSVSIFLVDVDIKDTTNNLLIKITNNNINLEDNTITGKMNFLKNSFADVIIIKWSKENNLYSYSGQMD